MEVKLISKPNNLKEIIYTACRTCYSEQTPEAIFEEVINPCKDCTSEHDPICLLFELGTCEKVNKVNTKKVLSLVNKVINSGHLSVLRHINFVFTLSGVSRACINQLERHIAGFAYSQQSMRYVEFDFETLKKVDVEKYYVIPNLKTEEQLELYKVACFNSMLSYRQLVQRGVKAEDARGILGLNFKTNVVVTCNLQALIHLCNLRMCNNAQQEIRALVKEMALEVLKKENWLKPYLKPKCFSLGYCNEFKSCGLKPKKENMCFAEPDSNEIEE